MRDGVSTGQSFLLVGLGVVALWDTATTIIGTYEILATSGGNAPALSAVSFLFGAILVVYLLNAVRIMYNPSSQVFPVMLKALWIGAAGYDLLTSYWGNRTYVVPLSDDATVLQWIILIGITIFVSSAPVIMSFILDERWKES